MENQRPHYNTALRLTAIGILAQRITNQTTKKLFSNQRDDNFKNRVHQQLDSLFGTLLTRHCADLYAQAHPELQITVVDPNNDGWSEYQVPKENEEGTLHIFYSKNASTGSQRKQELAIHNLMCGKDEEKHDQLTLFPKDQILTSEEFDLDDEDIKRHGDKDTTFCQLFLYTGQNNYITGADFTAPLPTKAETLFSYSIDMEEAREMADAMWGEGEEWLFPAIDLATMNLSIPKLEVATDEKNAPAVEANSGRKLDTSQEPMAPPIEDESTAKEEGEEGQAA